jgi:hypothetical protein
LNLDPNLVEIIGRFEIMDEYESADDLCSPDDNGDNSEAEDGNGHDETEIQEISELENFAETLKCAQRIAVTHERERDKGRKRPHRYTKKSKRTRERQAKIGKDMQKKGFLSVASFFAHIRQKIANQDGTSETSAGSQAPSSGAEIIEVPGGSGENLEMEDGESGGSDEESEKDEEEEDEENDGNLHGTVSVSSSKRVQRLISSHSRHRKTYRLIPRLIQLAKKSPKCWWIFVPAGRPRTTV